MFDSSAHRKLARGVKHIEALGREARVFEKVDAYVPRVERNVRSAQEVEYLVFAIEREAPNLDWPVMAGDAIQNLRSALDHAIYALVPKRNRGKSQFPIFTDECEFKVKGRPLIAGVPKAVGALIEAAQPYKTWPHQPAGEPLAVLSTLSNLDKHRSLATVASTVSFNYIGINDDTTEIEPVKPFSEGTPLHDGTQVSHFVARCKGGIDPMDVDPRFAYEVRIEGRPLIDTLRHIANRVFECVIECETGQPVSPFQQGYPVLY